MVSRVGTGTSGMEAAGTSYWTRLEGLLRRPEASRAVTVNEMVRLQGRLETVAEVTAVVVRVFVTEAPLVQ